MGWDWEPRWEALLVIGGWELSTNGRDIRWELIMGDWESHWEHVWELGASDGRDPEAIDDWELTSGGSPGWG